MVDESKIELRESPPSVEEAIELLPAEIDAEDGLEEEEEEEEEEDALLLKNVGNRSK